MKHGGSHTKTAIWYNFHWNRLWLDCTMGLRHISLGFCWHTQLNKDYRRTVRFNLHLIFFDIGFIYFIDPWPKEYKFFKST